MTPFQKKMMDCFIKHPIQQGEGIRPYCRRISAIIGEKTETVRRYYYRLGFSGAEKQKSKSSPTHSNQTKQSKEVNYDYDKGTAQMTYNGRERVTNIEEAIAKAGLDMNVWYVTGSRFKAYEGFMKDADSNPIVVPMYSCTVDFARIGGSDVDWDSVFDKLEDEIASCKPPKPKILPYSEDRVGVISTGDWHLGAHIDDLIRTDSFNHKVLIERLEESAERINSERFSEVHLCLLGDFIESFTGLNHKNVWKDVERGNYGMNAIRLCYAIMVNHYIGRINNVKSVNIVSGNHDRTSADKGEDTMREAAGMLAWLLDKDYGSVFDVEYNPMVISKKIDGINYILTHGDFKFSDKDISKILYDYGVQGVYNVVLKAHLHTRKVTKRFEERAFELKDLKVISVDECDHRVITCAPMFTGNFYSEALGYSSTAGFEILYNNGYGYPEHTSPCLTKKPLTRKG